MRIVIALERDISKHSAAKAFTLLAIFVDNSCCWHDEFLMMNKLKQFVLNFARKRPFETGWSIAGVVAGGLIGFIFVGGIGVAMLGGAARVPAAAVFAAIGGLVGNRYGVERDMQK